MGKVNTETVTLDGGIILEHPIGTIIEGLTRFAWLSTEILVGQSFDNIIIWRLNIGIFKYQYVGEISINVQCRTKS